MFKAVLGDPKILKSSIDTISNMIDEAGIMVTKEGLQLRAMDPAHVALVDYEVSKDAFQEYEIDGDAVMGIDLDRLNIILKRAGASDQMTLELDEDQGKLRILFKGTSTRKFDLPLIDISDEELKVPSLEFPSVVEFPPKLFSEGIKDAEIVSEHVSIETDKENFYIKAKGDLGNVEVQIKKDQTVDFQVKEASSSMFSIEYLKDMAKAADIADTVKVSLGNSIPIKMDFLAQGTKLSFLLAPRIESE